MEGWEERTLNYRGIQIYYYVKGEGIPLILMHGWGCNASTVSFIADCSLKSGYKVYNIDLPGFGQSSEPKEVWGVEDYAAMIEYLISQQEIKCPVLVGHSFGGRIAIVLGSRSNINKIILIDAAGIKPHRKLSYYFKVYSFKLLKKIPSFLFGGKQRKHQIIERQRQKRGSSDYSQASKRMREILIKTVNEDLKHLMPHIKASTLLIWGTNDTATPLKDAKTMNKLIADSGLVEIEGAGHYSFLDNPQKFKAAYCYFLTH